MHFYLLTTYPDQLHMFDTKLTDTDPQWLYVFSHTIEIPVPEDAVRSLYQDIPRRFDAARELVQKKCTDQLLALDKAQSQLLAIEG